MIHHRRMNPSTTFTIVIHSAPVSQQSLSALLFARAALEAGHGIYRLFFYGDGVHNASRLNVTPQDELDIPAAWRDLIEEHKLDAVVCIAAGLKRGLINESEAQRHEKLAYNLDPAFELSGLGQLLDAAVKSDRLVTFGG
jgi:tRNA 2-thiouridine synthesizing protein D